ncbi:MAG: hypothetical protein NVS3B25_34430 [Hymenobacter sp.]
MGEAFSPRISRNQAKTHLTASEKVLLYRMSSELKTGSESDTIRQALRRVWKEWGWIA